MQIDGRALDRDPPPRRPKTQRGGARRASSCLNALCLPAPVVLLPLQGRLRQPDQTKTSEFALGPAGLAFRKEDMQRVVEPALFAAMVGPNSAELPTVPLEMVER